jgi:hypothetical protein
MVLGKEGMSPLKFAFFKLRIHDPDLLRKACRRMAIILPRFTLLALWRWREAVEKGKQMSIQIKPTTAPRSNLPSIIDGTMKIKDVMNKRPRIALRNLKKNKHHGDLLKKAC